MHDAAHLDAVGNQLNGRPASRSATGPGRITHDNRTTVEYLEVLNAAIRGEAIDHQGGMVTAAAQFESSLHVLTDVDSTVRLTIINMMGPKED